MWGDGWDTVIGPPLLFRFSLFPLCFAEHEHPVERVRQDYVHQGHREEPEGRLDCQDPLVPERHLILV